MVTPEGPISVPLATMREMVAASAAFRAWAGVTTDTAALERVHLVDVTPPEENGRYGKEELEALRPLVVVDEFDFGDGRTGGEAWGMKRDGINVFVPSGWLTLTFEGSVPSEDRRNTGESKLAFMNKVGLVLADLMALGGGDVGEMLSIHGIFRWSSWRRANEARERTQGDHWTVTYAVQWGV